MQHTSVPETDAGDRRHYQRSWLWPFEPRRLSRVRALQIALFTIIVTFALRGLIASTIGLSDDEAWLWVLSQRYEQFLFLDPPLVPWLIRLSTRLFGTSDLTVRLPSMLGATAATFLMVRLVVRMGWAKGANTASVLFLTTPILFLGGVVASQHVVLLAFWVAMMDTSFAIGMGYERRRAGWMKLAVITGVALLATPTAWLGVSASMLWIASTRMGRKSFRTVWPYLAAVIGAAVVLIPAALMKDIIHAGPRALVHEVLRLPTDQSQKELARLAAFWVSQFLLQGPGLVLGWFLLFRDAALGAPGGLTSAERRLELRFLAIWALVPALFFIQPLFAEFRVHWAMFAFIPVILYLARLSAQKLRPWLGGLTVLAGAWLTATALIFLYVPVVPFLASAVGMTGPDNAFNPRYDLTNEFYGWERFSQHLRDVKIRLAQDWSHERVESLPLVAPDHETAAQAAHALGSTENIVVYAPQPGEKQLHWKSADAVPSTFVYVSQDPGTAAAAQAFPTHRCSPLAPLLRKRGPYIAREIRLDLCIHE